MHAYRRYMNFKLENVTEILDKYINGFRQYKLGESAVPTYISRNFCDMTGYSEEELWGEDGGFCASLVHPADKQLYGDFLKRVCAQRKSSSAEYRLVKKDGSVIYVRDTMTVEEAENGDAVGYSALADITDIKTENENLRFLNETVPCGMLKYTCEKNPKITYVNKQMIDIMRIPEVKNGEMDYFELYRDNIYLMIPIEERRKFSHFLQQVYTRGVPIAGEITVLRCDGTKARLYGWVTKVTSKDGSEEFQSVCMDVTERYHAKRASATERYLKALSDVYDKIFEYDFTNGTVKYVFGGSDTFSRIRNLPMHMEEATAQWLEHSVYKEDLGLMQAFFSDVFARRMSAGGNRPPQITYRVKKGEALQYYMGTFLKAASDVWLFCCRKVQDEREVDILRNENISLKHRNENIQEMMMRYTDGVASFEVTEDCVTPLYASDNVCEFFGFTKEEWLPLMKRSTPIREFVSHSAVDYEKFSALLQNGEAEFTYYDIGTDTEQRIKAICSQKQAEGNFPRYVLLYKMGASDKQDEAAAEEHKIYIRTFGYFDVFVDDKPIAFRNKKAKELLALLVDRRGGYVTSDEAIGYLWENESANAVTLARYRKEALRLKNTLEEYGVGGIVESVDGKRRVIPEKLSCDLYDYLSGKEEYAGLFKGSYLTNYAWGEMTLCELLNDNSN